MDYFTITDIFGESELILRHAFFGESEFCTAIQLLKAS
jgi:hypothetical protein